MGGVKYRPYQKNRNHWKQAQKLIFKGSGCFQFPETVVTSRAKKSLCSTGHGSLQVFAVLYE